jgi:hypothetical protein
LFETTARLQPGRRGSIVLVTASDRKARADGQIIRSELTAIGPSGELLYRTAIAFSEEFDFTRRGMSELQDHRAVLPLEFSGPLTARWKATTSSQTVTITRISEVACTVARADAAAAGQQTHLTVSFSPVRAVNLSGRVYAVDPMAGCLVQFERLNAETRHVLRTEIREAVAAQLRTPENSDEGFPQVFDNSSSLCTDEAFECVVYAN